MSFFFLSKEFRLPLLTWEKNVSHVYTQPGTYIATIEAINSVSSAYVQIPIKVYSEYLSNCPESFNIESYIILMLQKLFSLFFYIKINDNFCLNIWDDELSLFIIGKISSFFLLLSKHFKHCAFQASFGDCQSRQPSGKF